MTLIKEKFDYKPIERKQIDGKRKINTHGFAVASVTTILDATKDKTHPIAWRKRVGEQKAQEINKAQCWYSECTNIQKILLKLVNGQSPVIPCSTAPRWLSKLNTKLLM